jgi:hypothetical protein
MIGIGTHGDWVGALIEQQFCIHEAARTFFFEWWLIAGAVLLALAWCWPSISGFGRWLRMLQAAGVPKRWDRGAVRYAWYRRTARHAPFRFGTAARPMR